MASAYISGRRSALASFDHAYAVAVQLRQATGVEQLVIRTGSSVQPFRVFCQEPRYPEEVLARVA